MNDKPKRLADHFEAFIFGGRWILAPLYGCLTLALLFYAVRFIIEFYHIGMHITEMEEGALMLSILNLVDMLMTANLISMIGIGGYSSFVRKIDFAELKNRPQGFSQLNSGALKVKMGTSLIGVSSVHLLKAFVNAEHQNWDTVKIMLTIHVAFILSTIALVMVDKLMHSAATLKEDGH